MAFVAGQILHMVGLGIGHLGCELPQRGQYRSPHPEGVESFLCAPAAQERLAQQDCMPLGQNSAASRVVKLGDSLESHWPVEGEELEKFVDSVKELIWLLSPIVVLLGSCCPYVRNGDLLAHQI